MTEDLSSMSGVCPKEGAEEHGPAFRVGSKRPYLRRRDERLHTAVLKRRIAAGLIAGWLAVTIGFYKYYFVVGANDTVWAWVAGLGAGALAVAVAFPAVFAWPEMLMHKAGTAVFQGLFYMLLVVQYLFFFLPLGFFFRWRQPGYLLPVWDRPLGGRVEGWTAKTVESGSIGENERRRSSVMAPVEVIAYFARQGHYLLIPGLLLMLLLGLALVFVKTTAIAPFIYTLF